MDGLTLSQLFYEQVARSIIESVVAPEDYSAGLIGWSSEVIGMDDVYSQDHNWGPRLIVFLLAENFTEQRDILDQQLQEKLPHSFKGYPTNFGQTKRGDQLVMLHSEQGPVNHFIQIECMDDYLQNFLQIDPQKAISSEDWLKISEHNLLGFTEGKVFHDGHGQLREWRSRMSFYPNEVWYRLMIKQWRMIAEEEAFVGRTAARGDMLGSLLITGRIIHGLMRLVYLMERSYAPYSKWFGSRFEQLESGPALVPHLEEAIQGSTYELREAALVRAYKLVTGIHNQARITPAVKETISPAYEGRPGLVLHANRFAEALEQVMKVALLLLILILTSLPQKAVAIQAQDLQAEELVEILEEVYRTEQEPIRKRDSLIALFGVESEKVKQQQRIYEQNHAQNEKIVREILDSHGWPEQSIIGERGNLIISNVIQHADNDIRIKYLPLMRQAVQERQLHPRFLVRAEDRIATERGELQIYGGQMKYYPETKSFNVWPVYDPENINKRRAAIGLGSIEEHLKTRFNFEWDLEEQIRRTKEFEARKKNKDN